MKTITIAALVALLLAVPAAAQDRPGGKPSRSTSTRSSGPPTNEQIGPMQPHRLSSTPKRAAVPSDKLPPGIGVCLIGDNYGYIDDLADAEKCDAVMWVNTVAWANNQRKLIDQSTLAGDGNTTTEGEVICRSCSGTCQTVSLPIEESKYEDVETDGGQSPSECLTSIRQICESGSYRHLASARCGN